MKQTQPMPSDAKPRLTPKLRFPEFRKEPAWAETILNTVLTEHGETNDGSGEVHSVSVHKGVINQVEHLGRSFAAADRSNYNLAKPHDIIYTKSPTGDFPYGIVKQNHLKYNVIVSPLYGVFSPTNKHLGYILDVYFESPTRTSNYLAPITQKGAKNTLQISNPTFLSKGIYLPSIKAEQQKIAECLGSLDELIKAESQKLDALKGHKKGLMQQLFPREGETLPHLRFPEFKNAPTWTKKSMSQVVVPAVRERHKPATAYTGLGLRSHGKGTFLKISENPEKNSMDVLYEVKPNDLILNITFAWEGAIAIAQECDDGALVSHRFPTYTVNSREAIPGFLRYVILNKRFVHSLGLISPGGAGRNRVLNKKDFLGLFILLPEVEEQQRIASCLSSLDDLISTQSTKVETLKAHKQGLMQQLFPSPMEEEA